MLITLDFMDAVALCLLGLALSALLLLRIAIAVIDWRERRKTKAKEAI